MGAVGRRLGGSGGGVAWVAVVVALSLAAPASAEPARPGPGLRADPVAMGTALSCPDGLSRRSGAVVLFVHGHGVTAAESWPAGFGEALSGADIDWCMVSLPNRSLGDVQTNAEYVVSAVRTLSERTGRQVSLVGHSQGAMESRWAVRWWPDVSQHVADVITVAGANRPLEAGRLFCTRSCTPSEWQWSPGSEFLEVLNRVPTPGGPSYTTIRSLTDWTRAPEVEESTSGATIDGAANVLIQNICPGRVVEHVQAIFDAVFFAVLLDALHHDGPADQARVDPRVCREMFAPGVDPVLPGPSLATIYANVAAAVAAAPKTDHEPPLRPYARAG